jgi:hypothetical protein
VKAIYPTVLVENQTVKAQRRSHESELPDSHKRRRNIQIQGKAWVLRGEITTDLLLNNASKASMDHDDDADLDAQVQNTKSQTEAAQTFKIQKKIR